MTGTGLRVAGVRVRLGGADVVDGVSFDVARGRWLAILGPNGAGKSTLLRAVAGLVRHDGEVAFGGRPLAAMPPRERARHVAYAPQTPVLPPELTVLDYVLLGRTPYLGYLARPGGTDRDVAWSVLDRLQLAPLAGRLLVTLSGGERQRTVLARALAQQAALLLLDEPTTSLDIGHQQQVLELVDRLRLDDGLTVVTSLHDLTLAGQYADALLLMVAGRAVAQGSAAEVLTEAAVRRHYGATVEVLPGRDGRPTVRPLRGHRP